MIDIVCINPKEYSGAGFFGGMPPLGLAWIATTLEKHDYSVRIIDLEIENVEIKSLITDLQPKVVCISGSSHTRFESFKIAKEIKEVDTSIITLYGGPHATFTAQDTLSHIKEIDVIVCGEGEYTVLNVINKIIKDDGNLSEVAGISYKGKGGIIYHNPPGPRIEDLDLIGFPARHLLKMDSYHLNLEFINIPATSIMTSRGCPINCSYCSASAMWGKRYTYRSAVSVADEIEEILSKYNVKGIKFFDSTLTLNRNHIKSLCEEFQKRGFNFPWECEIRVNTVDKELLAMMKRSGCYYVDFGVESASPRVLKLMHKGITIEQVENVLNWADELGIYTKVFFTYGHIGETLEDALMTMKFVKKHRHKITSLGGGVGINIYPGTEVERYAREKSYLPPNFSWSEPYDNSEYQFLGVAPGIPLLLQSQMDYSTLRKLRYLELKKKIIEPKSLFEKLLKMKSYEDWKKAWIILKEMVKGI